MSTPRRLTSALIALGVAATGASLVSAAEPIRDDRLTSAERRTVHEATKKYKSLDAAEADGYVPAGECAAHPELGGMGFHYLNPGLIGDSTVDPTRPEILVYTPHDNGSLRLVAVEWFVVDDDQNLETDRDRPSLFDRLPFDGPMPGHDADMPIHYDLHVWLYANNPAGQLAPFNPRVGCDA